MAVLKDLVQDVLVDHLEHAREGTGIAAWLTWKGELDPSLEQSFQDYGGTLVIKKSESGLWFFFSVEAYMAFARVQLWSKMHSVALSIVVMPAKIYLGENNSRKLWLPPELLSQSSPALDGFNIWIHPEIAALAQGLPGLIFEPARASENLLPLDWKLVHTDSRLSYRSSFGWYCVLRPLGNPLEKRFQMGWRDFFGELENILQRQKFKYTLHNNFLLFPLDTLSQFRTWCRDYFNLVGRLKEEGSEHYWPCVQAVVDKRGLIFNNELPNKIGLDWDQLMPDFPHMTYRNGYLLGEDFMLHGVRFEAGENSLNDWCNVSLKQEGDETSGFLPVIVPVRLVSGKEPQCFYCGLRNHRPAHCPSKKILDWQPGVWNRVASMDFSTMNSGLRQIDNIIGELGEEGISSLLLEGDAPENTLVQAVFDINSMVQHHMMPRIWLSRAKDCPKDFSADSGLKDDNPIWKLLEKLPDGELIPLEKELQNVIQRQSRDYRLLCLNGFLALEREEPIRAAGLWKDAEAIASTPLQQAYMQYLQARIVEIDGKYEHAGLAYGAILNACPNWLEPRYRQVVCMVKMGFAEQAVPDLLKLMAMDPNYFNRAIIDPEMERGHIQLLSSLYTPWAEAEERAPEELATLQGMRKELDVWFAEDHKFAVKMKKRVDAVLGLAGIANYVPYQRIIQNRTALEKEMQQEVSLESRVLRNQFKMFRQRLNKVQEEAAWFPFPRLLTQFTRTYNSVNKSTAWALKANLFVSDTFHKARQLAEKEEAKIKKLESQIKFLKVVRDSTLFALIMGKLFLWVEVVMLILVFAGLPLLLYYGERSSLGFGSELLFKQKWQLQKGLVIIFSVLALAISALRTASIFEKRRDALLKKNKPEAAEREKK